MGITKSADTRAPAGASANSFVVREFKPYSKNSLVAFVSLEMPSGLVIHNITLHEKNGSRWVSMPAREYQQKDSERTWMPLIEFADRDCRESFQQRALEAIDAYLAGGGE